MTVTKQNTQRLLQEARRALESEDWAAAHHFAEAASWLDATSAEARAIMRAAAHRTTDGGRAVQAAPQGPPARLLHPHSHNLSDVVEASIEMLGADLRSRGSTEAALLLANSPLLRAIIPCPSTGKVEETWGKDAMEVFQTAAAAMTLLPETSNIDREALGQFALTVGLLTDLSVRERHECCLGGFLAGILHTVGLLALDAYCPDGIAEVRTLAEGPHRRVHDREQMVFGFANAELAGHLVAYWGCDPVVVSAIASQGVRDEARLEPHPIARALIRARIYARARGLHDGLEASPAQPSAGPWPPELFQREIDRFRGWGNYQHEIAGLIGHVYRASGI